MSAWTQLIVYENVAQDRFDVTRDGVFAYGLLHNKVDNNWTVQLEPLLPALADCIADAETYLQEGFRVLVNLEHYRTHARDKDGRVLKWGCREDAENYARTLVPKQQQV